MFANQPVGKEWLSRMTGYSDKLVASALNYLFEMGYVTSSGRYEAWQINTEAVQLPLVEFELPQNSSRNFSDSLPTTATALIVEKNDQSVVAAEESKRSRNFSDSRKLLHSANVGEPMASVLADLPHVTPYYIAGHILKAKEDGIKVGLLIHRIHSSDPAPELNQRYHLLDCDCFYCSHFCFSPACTLC